MKTSYEKKMKFKKIVAWILICAMIFDARVLGSVGTVFADEIKNISIASPSKATYVASGSDSAEEIGSLSDAELIGETDEIEDEDAVDTNVYEDESEEDAVASESEIEEDEVASESEVEEVEEDVVASESEVEEDEIKEASLSEADALPLRAPLFSTPVDDFYLEIYWKYVWTGEHQYPMYCYDISNTGNVKFLTGIEKQKDWDHMRVSIGGGLPSQYGGPQVNFDWTPITDTDTAGTPFAELFSHLLPNIVGKTCLGMFDINGNQYVYGDGSINPVYWSPSNWYGYIQLKWDPGEFVTIEFDEDGGTSVSDIYSVKDIGLCLDKDLLTYVTDDFHIIDKKPTKKGYLFKGFFKDGVQYIDENGKRTSNLTDDAFTDYGETVILKAEWQLAPVYEITLDNQGGTGTVDKIYEIYSLNWSLNGTDYMGGSAMPRPNLDGFIFDGYYTNDGYQVINNGGRWNAPLYTIFATNSVIFAHWKPKSIAINLNKGTGTGTIAPSRLYYRDDVIYKDTYCSEVFTTFTSVPSLTGQTFIGFYYNNKQYIKADGTRNTVNWTADSFAGISLGSSINFVAQYGPLEYNIVFNTGNHATLPSGITKYVGVDISLATPSSIEDGYQFVCWCSDSACTTPYDGTTDLSPIDGVATVYAKWKVRVRYNVNGHGTVTPTEEFVVKDSQVTLPTVANVTGYSNDSKWYKEMGCTNDVGTMGASYTASAPIDLYVRWETMSYTLHFDLGSVTADPITDMTKYYNESVTLPVPTNVQSGYTLKEWYYVDTGSVEHVYTGNSDLTTTQGATITIYARWIQKIVFNNNGHGVAPAPMDVVIGNITLPDITIDNTCVGYKFTGWYDGSDISTSNKVGNPGNTYTVTGATTLHAGWEPITYNIHFDTNGVTVDAISDKSKTYGTALSSLPTPTGFASGYTFVGWYKEAALTNEFTVSSDFGVTSIETKTVYAKWKVKVTYNVNGHGTIATTEETVVKGSSITLPTVANVAGYTNDSKWYKETGCTNVVGTMGTSYTASAPIDLYVKWTEKEYTITYNLNGGTWITEPSANDKKRKYTESKTLALDTTFKKAGYNFLGWYDNSSFAGSAWTEVPVNTDANKQFYAKWDEVTYKIVYEYGGHGSGSDYVMKTYGATCTLQNPATVDNGYVFSYWCSDSACTTKYTGNTELEFDSSNVAHVYAKWKVKITYNNNGHGTVPSNKQVDIGSSVNLGSVSGSVTGYSNDGKWYGNVDCTGTPVANMNTAITVDIPLNLYVKWEEIKYTLILNPNTSGQTGTVTPSSEVTQAGKTYTENIVLNNPFTSTTHTFGGWSLSDGVNNVKKYNEGVTVNKLTSVNNGTVTLYAKWVPGSYKVIFHGNGSNENDTAMGIQTIEVGKLDEHLSKNTYTKTGHKFKGWSSTSSGSIEYTDKQIFAKTDATLNQEFELFAIWEPVTYIIKYNTNGGQVSPTQVTKTYGAPATLPPTPVKHAYIFDGWYKNKSLVDIYDESMELASTENAVANIYAKWTLETAAYEITFDANGGNGTMYPQGIYTDETISLNQNKFTRSGYSFNGWKDASGVEYKNGQSISGATLTGNIILTAQWKFNGSSGNVAPYHESGNGGSRTGGNGNGAGGAGAGGAGGLDNLNNNNSNNFEGPVTNKNIRFIEDPIIKTGSNGRLIVNDKNGEMVEGFCRMYDSYGVEQYYYIDDNSNMYCGFLSDSADNLYHFDDANGAMNKGGTVIDGKTYSFSDDGLYVGALTNLPGDQNFLEVLKDNWQYNPVNDVWSFSKTTQEGETVDSCANGIYELYNNGSKDAYCFGLKGELIVGKFKYMGNIVCTSENDSDKGVIKGILGPANETLPTKIEPTKKLKNTHINSINNYILKQIAKESINKSIGKTRELNDAYNGVIDLRPAG